MRTIIESFAMQHRDSPQVSLIQFANVQLKITAYATGSSFCQIRLNLSAYLSGRVLMMVVVFACLSVGPSTEGVWAFSGPYLVG